MDIVFVYKENINIFASKLMKKYLFICFIY